MSYNQHMEPEMMKSGSVVGYHVFACDHRWADIRILAVAGGPHHVTHQPSRFDPSKQAVNSVETAVELCYGSSMTHSWQIWQWVGEAGGDGCDLA